MYIAAYPCRGGWASGWVEGDKVATIESALDARKAGPGTTPDCRQAAGLLPSRSTRRLATAVLFDAFASRVEAGANSARPASAGHYQSDLDDVREAAGAAAQLVKAGTDPIEERKRVRLEAIAAAKAAKPSTFDAMVDGYLRRTVLAEAPSPARSYPGAARSRCTPRR